MLRGVFHAVLPTTLGLSVVAKRSFAGLALCGLCSLGACVEGPSDSSGPPAGPNPAMEAFRADSIPETATRVRFDFGSKVQLVGYELNSVDARPGGKVKVTWYWRSSSAPQGDWKLFTHLLDAQGRQIANFDQAGPLRGAGSISAWQDSATYADEQEIELPTPLPKPFVTLGLGVWTDVVRLELIGGVNDDKNRALVARIPTGS